MMIIREQYGLTALRVGYSQGGRGGRRPGEVTCSLRGPQGESPEWRVPADGIALLGDPHPPRTDDGIEAGLAGCLRYLEPDPAMARLRGSHDAALWLAVTSEHPLLPGVAWERGLDALGLPLLRLPARLNTAPAALPPRPRVAVCLSMPVAKASFVADELVEQVLAAVEALGTAHEVHVFADVEWAATLRSRFGGRARVHEPPQPARPSTDWSSPREAAPDDGGSWPAWIEEAMEGRIDVLQLIGHGYLASGQGAFAVAEAPDRNLDRRTARFLWPQQIAELMASTGAWGLVTTAVGQNYSVPGLRLLTSQVAASRAAAAAFVDAAGDDELQLPAHVEAVYRLLLRYPAPPPPDTRNLMLIMHPGRFGLEAPVTSDYRPGRTELADLVDSGDDVPAWMVGAQNQLRQWETELSFDSSSRQVESTRTAFEVAKARIDEAVQAARRSGGAS